MKIDPIDYRLTHVDGAPSAADAFIEPGQIAGVQGSNGTHYRLKNETARSLRLKPGTATPQAIRQLLRRP